MLQVQELRVGNTFIDSGGNTRPVEARDFEKIEQSPAYYAGVPLTEVVLKVLDFVHDASQQIWNREDICLSYSDRYKGFTLFVNHEYETGKPFEYLHELQNLYFALLREELPGLFRFQDIDWHT